MAKYKAYPEYKDSGVEWLENTPTHWTVAPIKYLALDASSLFLDGDWIESKDISEAGVRYITTGNVGEGSYKEQGAGFITENTFEKLSCTEVFEGDILISRLNNPIGRACLVPNLGYKIVTSVDNVILRIDKEYNKKYLIYLFSSKDYFQHTGNLARGTTMQRISRGLLGNIRLSLPTFSEQMSIASFLDHETTKIDDLIEKQQQLIELLKEKRQAVISHAVTKGLNPNVPMKDSGVEWLGEVPEHWVIAQLKFNTLEMQTGPFGSQLHAEDYIVDGIPLINPAHMYSGEIIPDLQVTVDESTQKRLERHKLLEGEIIFSRRGELGRCAVVKKEHVGWLCGTGSLKAKLTKKIVPEYAYILISSDGVVSELTLESKGSTMANLNTETLGRIRLPVPTISEQKVILDYIKVISDKYDHLILSANTAIQLMQERRTALISAAVTGKIDVRDWVAPANSEMASIEESQEVNA
ncbi:restriction endonuclease subunit S [Pectobacterium brasiliense]|uniref:Restriction endonuclease subunit S n=1 Tax=Pectobacterium brasiliense TaxID=180957 RepID=A0AAE2WCH1_9GAMM|nr:restriction endonuclease subunit S [Pectobacterium brasiliense]MBA0218305.1 restriction endonuclease subunit S [Pectobacterium brasiliense]MBN3049916.1 restriction endonuclease subunit S [Pectobacterium brasiliense]MBN3072122.1 restriction endonuclease subunit S [Pectobacterium brasiliense]MBN3171317.1 restriction endonuclease subunit S [Pectobacterium brasiliense]